MPLVPERKSSRQEVKAAINGQFWEQPVHSTRYLDGVAWNLPCEPPALNLIGSSGLSRSQQLIAAQAMGVPAVPSYDGNSDGLVFDRVLAKFGGRKWWTAFSGRTKVQRIFKSASNSTNKLDALRDLDNYAVCARGRFQLGRQVTVNGTVEMSDAHMLYQMISGQVQDSQNGSSVEDSLAYHASMRCELPGHDVTANIGCNMEYADSSGDFARVPLAVSVDLSSLDRGDGLQYKVGLHQVSAPMTEAEHTGPSTLPLNTVLHAQGAVAVEGEAYVWRGGSSAAKPNADTKPSDSQAEGGAPEDHTQTQIGKSLASATAADQGLEVDESSTSASTSALPDGKGEGPWVQQQGEAGPPAVVTTPTSAPAPAPAPDAVEDKEHHSTFQDSLESFIRPLEDLGHTLQESIHLPSFIKPQEEVESKAPLPVQHPNRLLPVTADSINTVIEDSLALLTRVKRSVAKVASDVQDGSLQRLSEQLSPKPVGRRRPYSMMLGQPYLKLNAAMGCLARMPLPTLLPVEPQPIGLRSSGRAPLLGRHNASTSSLASASSQLAEAWEPYLKGTALRVFASASLSGQIGRFSRRFLDYTAGVLRLDVGLSSPHVVGAAPGDVSHRPDKHRAFALEGRGSWHALSASVTQQLYGPIRTRADFRFALDPTNVPQDQGERSTLKGVAQTALSVRPSLLEAVYGFDSVLPGTEGAGRIAIWWSPKRRQAMAELRLF